MSLLITSTLHTRQTRFIRVFVPDYPMDLDSWRYGCPRHHTNLEVHDAGVYCPGCNDRDMDSWHTTVIDRKTGEEIELPV